MVYYNEFDPFAAEWLRNLMAVDLIPQGVVDETDIRKVKADDVRGFATQHYFAGIGGWPLALRLAGWPDSRPVWSGSCPCQDFSAAGKRKGIGADRDLWPTFASLIRKRRPAIVFGEQVDSAIGHGWLDRVHVDMEAENYAVGAAVLPASGVGSPIRRYRLFFVARAGEDGRRPRGRKGRHEANTAIGQQETTQLERCGNARTVARGACHGRDERRAESGRGSVVVGRGPVPVGESDDSREGPRAGLPARPIAERDGGVVGVAVGDTNNTGSQGRAGVSGDDGSEREAVERAMRDVGAWSDFRIIECRDEWPDGRRKSRRISTERGSFPLAHGLPNKLGQLLAELGRVGVDRKAVKRLKRAAKGILDAARRNRNGRLKGYGNAICPQAAAVFIQSVM